MARARDLIADRPRGGDLRSLGVLLSHLRPYRRQVLHAATALLVAAACVLLLGQGLRRVIDHGLAAADATLLDRTLLALLGLIIVLAVSTWARFYWVSWIGERVTADLRRSVFNHLLDLSPAFFETTRTGEVISRLTNDTALLEVVIGSSISLAVRNVLLLVGSLAMLLLTSVKLTLLVLLGVPAVVVPILVFGRRVRRLARAAQDRVADVASAIDETLHEVRTVQAWTHEDEDRAAFAARVEAAFEGGVARVRQRASLVGMVMLLAFSAVGVILWMGGHDVLAGRISAGDLSAFVFYAVLMAGAVGAVSEVIGDLQRAAGASERLAELLAAPPAHRAMEKGAIDEVAAGGAVAGQGQDLPAMAPRHVQGRPGDIDLCQICFSYPSRPGQWALDRLDLQVRAGERVALVGPSGAGKSTIFQLLLRFYEPQAGSIRVDGADITTLDPRTLRQRFALVPQDPVIFATSVTENVRYARPHASAAEVAAACDAAQAIEFIERLPQGYDTFLGERGVRLSGGQRQRIAIARAILADRPILLLDEATSALDAQSEALVQRALETLVRGRTTLVIAHRLATVKTADRIVLLEGGRVQAQGTHESLMRAGGLYAELATLQFLAAREDSAGHPAEGAV